MAYHVIVVIHCTGHGLDCLSEILDSCVLWHGMRRTPPRRQRHIGTQTEPGSPAAKAAPAPHGEDDEAKAPAPHGGNLRVEMHSSTRIAGSACPGPGPQRADVYSSTRRGGKRLSAGLFAHPPELGSRVKRAGFDPVVEAVFVERGSLPPGV